jgi:ketosteroid isomerase-like protein
VASTNVDLVRSIFAAWERGDYSRPEEWAHPEIEFVFADGPSPGRWVGLAGLADAWRGFLSAWEEWRSEADEYRELDNERVLVLAHYGGRGKASRFDVTQVGTESAGVFHVRGGKVIRLVFYFDRARALADLGLHSEAGSESS